jgi:putative ABC transport system permease protein
MVRAAFIECTRCNSSDQYRVGGRGVACFQDSAMAREMIGTIAFKNMMHDPMRFLVTAVGIGLSLVLVTVQLGLLAGFDRTISAMLDHAKADLWILPTGTAAFDDPALLESSMRYKALAIRGVERATPMLVGYAEWRKPGSGSLSVIVIGSDPKSGTMAPWDISKGKAEDLRAPDAVAIDASYSEQLGVQHVGDLARIEGRQARVAVITSGIRSFTTSPYVFTSLSQARVFLNTEASKTSYLAVELSSGADPATVRNRLAAKMENLEVLTTNEFRRRNVERWLLETGAGIALLSGAALAVLVGSVVMTQTLYASVNDHRREFATLRAMGSSKGFLRAVVLCQAAIGAAAGCAMALVADAAVATASANSAMPIHITPSLSAVLLALAFLMSMAAALSAASKVARVDPASVFAQ